MAVQPGLFVARAPGGNGTTPTGARQALAGLLAKNADGTVRTGVLADGLGPVVTGTAGMSYTVRKHVAVTKASEANGPVLVPNDGAVTVSTTPSPGSNSRIDVVYVLQRLVTGDGGSESTNAPIIDVAQGSVSATPSKPSIPTGATELGSFVVTSGATATSALAYTPGRFTWANSGPGHYGAVAATAVQSLDNASEVPITFNATTAIVSGGVTADATGLTVAESGTYTATAVMSVAASNTNGSRILVFRVDGLTRASFALPVTAGAVGYPVTTQLELVAGEKVTYRLYQSSGGAVNTHTQAYPSLRLSLSGKG